MLNIKDRTKKFSIPFNGDNPELFLQKIKPYESFIENFYLGIPSLIGNHLNHMIMDRNDINSIIDHENNCLRFLKLTKGKFKRLITINAASYDFDAINMQMFLITRLATFIEQFEIDGLILSDFNMAKQIHEWFPNLELHTSCNCFQWNLKTMEYWQNECGISVFNPPREILRSPEKLKEMHDAGFKLKCIVNEACLFGCPQMINHCVNVVKGNFTFTPYCSYVEEEAIFKTNWILPRWLDKFDDYVDIYKIVDRTFTTDHIIFILDAYVTQRNNVNLLDIISGKITERLDARNVVIPVNEIPDKLLACECKECGKTCSLCKELSKKYDLRG